MLELPESGQVQKIEVTIVSLQGSTLTALSVGNKRSKQFLSPVSEKWAAKHYMLEKMQQAGIKSVVVSAKAAYRGTTILWTVLSDFAEVEAQIAAQISAHNNAAFAAQEYLRKQAEFKAQMVREKEERAAAELLAAQQVVEQEDTNEEELEPVSIDLSTLTGEELKAARKAAKQAEKAAKIAAKKGRI